MPLTELKPHRVSVVARPGVEVPDPEPAPEATILGTDAAQRRKWTNSILKMVIVPKRHSKSGYEEVWFFYARCICIYDIVSDDTWALVENIPLSSKPTSAVFLAKTRQVWVGVSQGIAIVFESKTHKVSKKFVINSAIVSIGHTADTSLVFCCTVDGNIYAWAPTTYEQKMHYNMHSDTVSDFLVVDCKGSEDIFIYMIEKRMILRVVKCNLVSKTIAEVSEFHFDVNDSGDLVRCTNLCVIPQYMGTDESASRNNTYPLVLTGLTDGSVCVYSVKNMEELGGFSAFKINSIKELNNLILSSEIDSKSITTKETSSTVYIDNRSNKRVSTLDISTLGGMFFDNNHTLWSWASSYNEVRGFEIPTNLPDKYFMVSRSSPFKYRKRIKTEDTIAVLGLISNSKNILVIADATGGFSLWIDETALGINPSLPIELKVPAKGSEWTRANYTSEAIQESGFIWDKLDDITSDKLREILDDNIDKFEEIDEQMVSLTGKPSYGILGPLDSRRRKRRQLLRGAQTSMLSPSGTAGMSMTVGADAAKDMYEADRKLGIISPGMPKNSSLGVLDISFTSPGGTNDVIDRAMNSIYNFEALKSSKNQSTPKKTNSKFQKYNAPSSSKYSAPNMALTNPDMSVTSPQSFSYINDYELSMDASRIQQGNKTSRNRGLVGQFYGMMNNEYSFLKNAIEFLKQLELKEQELRRLQNEVIIGDVDGLPEEVEDNKESYMISELEEPIRSMTDYPMLVMNERAWIGPSQLQSPLRLTENVDNSKHGNADAATLPDARLFTEVTKTGTNAEESSTNTSVTESLTDDIVQEETQDNKSDKARGQQTIQSNITNQSTKGNNSYETKDNAEHTIRAQALDGELNARSNNNDYGNDEGPQGELHHTFDDYMLPYAPIYQQAPIKLEDDFFKNLYDRIKELEDQLSKTLEAKTELENENAALKDKIQSLLEQLDKTTEAVRDLSDKLANTTRDLEDMTTKDARHKAKAAERKQEIASLNNKLNELQNLYDDLLEKLKQEQERSKELEKQIEELEQEKQDLEQELDEKTKQYEGTIADLKGQLDNKGKKLADLQERHDKSVNKARKDIGQLKNKLKNAEAEISGLKNDNGKLQNELDELKDTNKQLQDEIERLKAELNKINKENEDLKNTVKENEKKISDLQDELKNLRDKHNELTEKHDKSLEDIKALEDKVAELEKELADLKKQHDDEIAELNNSLDRLKAKDAQDEEKIKELEGKIAELEDNVHKLEAENDSLKERLNDLEQEKEELLMKCKNHEDKLNNLDSCINKLLDAGDDSQSPVSPGQSGEMEKEKKEKGQNGDDPQVASNSTGRKSTSRRKNNKKPTSVPMEGKTDGKSEHHDDMFGFEAAGESDNKNSKSGEKEGTESDTAGKVIDRCDKKLDDMLKEVNGPLAQKLEGLEKDVESLKEANENLSKEKEMEREHLEEELGKLDEQVKSLKDLVLKLEQTNDKLKLDVVQNLSIVNDYKERYLALLANYNMLNDTHSALEKDYNGLTLTQKKTEGELESAHAQLENCRLDLERHDKLLTDKQVELQEAGAHIEAAESRITELQSQSQELERTLAAARDETVLLEKRVEGLRKERNAQEKEKVGHMNEIDRLKDDVSRLQDKVRSETEKQRAAAEALKRVMVERDKYFKSSESKQAKLEASEKQANALRLDLEDAKSTVERLKEANSSQKEKLERLKAQLESAREKEE